MNPSSTGEAMKLATHPIRTRPKMMNITPVTMANHEVRAMKSSSSPPAIGPTMLAERMATVELGPTNSCRDVPNIA